MDEKHAVDLLKRVFGNTARAWVGNGDDAVVLRRVQQPLVLSVDASVEGVHFERSFVKLRDVGFRSHAAAVSDLAAMAASPLCSLSALVVPCGFTRAQLKQLALGQQASAKAHDCPIVGGNLSRGSELSVTTTVVGHAASPLRRSGARPGHTIWLIGAVGLARAGLELLRSKRKVRVSAAARRAALNAFCRPEARLSAGRRLKQRASALIDVSDGLLADGAQLARESGVRLCFDWARLLLLPSAELRAVCEAFRAEPVEWALAGGEDYALLATGPSARRPRFACEIGHVTKGAGVQVLGGPAWSKRLSGFDHLR